jgi:hypothetical protein
MRGYGGRDGLPNVDRAGVTIGVGGHVSLSELSDMFQNYLPLVSVINGCIGNGKRNPRIFAMPA